MAEHHPARAVPVQRRYLTELKGPSVRLAFETAAEQGEWHGAVGKSLAAAIVALIIWAVTNGHGDLTEPPEPEGSHRGG